MMTEDKRTIVRGILLAKLAEFESKSGPVGKDDFDVDRFVEGLPYQGSVDIVKEIEEFDFRSFFAAKNRMEERNFSINFEKEFAKLDKTKKTAVVVWFDPKFNCFTLNEVLLSDAEYLIKESSPFDFDLNVSKIDDEFAKYIGRNVLDFLAARNEELRTEFKD